MVPSLLCTFVAHIIFLHVFFLSPFPSLSLSPPLSLSLSPSPSFSLSVSLCLSLSMSLGGCKTRVIWCPLPNILFLINLTFHALSLHSSYKIHQPFTDYLLRLPSSELLEKHLFRSRANRRLVWLQMLRFFILLTVSCLQLHHAPAAQCVQAADGLVSQSYRSNFP